MSASIEVRQAMFSLIEQWQQSGLSQKRFCEDNNIVVQTFYYWFKRYREQTNKVFEPLPEKFIGIHATSPISDRTAVEILLASGHRIIFTPTVSASFIKEIIS